MPIRIGLDHRHERHIGDLRQPPRVVGDGAQVDPQFGRPSMAGVVILSDTVFHACGCC
jgi:hypothetical protein